ncbi:hypothetical protein P3T76_013708 [Phytophthora citrophthora]|uniref:Uncharacterized protein n=1 Tax=Phytophthora citrophthora TaxID=4793 RepID=A0AAD9G271_9STRA|nr:hypothetical protein P3T76_013708 [Phytophthora citrophthora]
MAPASPRSDAASGHDTDTPGAVQLGKRKYSHTTAAQRQTLLQWLELPGNFDLLTKPVSAVKINNEQAIAAAASSSPPPPKRVKKTEGYRSLAQHMNRVALTDWSEKTARSRFESFMSAYRKAKRQNPPDQLPTFYQRVDALFGPDGDRELARFRSESVGQRSEGSRSPLLTRESEAVFQELSIATPLARALSEGKEASSPPRRRARLPETRPLEPVVPKVEEAEEQAPSSPVKEAAMTPVVNNEAIQPKTQPSTSSTQTVNDHAESQQVATVSDQLESQRLAVKQQELELKQSELRAKQDESRQKLRAEVLTKLVEAGKSPAEVREYLAIMDPVDNPARP